jgi:hypothetical protein
MVAACCTSRGGLSDLAAVHPSAAEWGGRLPTALLFTGPVVQVIDLRDKWVRSVLGVGLALGLTACGPARSASTPSTGLVLLTRDGCVGSAKMRANLEAALRELHRVGEYQVVDQGALVKTDSRTGYPTPTLLYTGRDLFGMAEPRPPFPEPT